MVSLSQVKLVVEAAPNSAGSLLAQDHDLDLLNHLVVKEAEKEGDRHALAGRCNRGDHL